MRTRLRPLMVMLLTAVTQPGLEISTPVGFATHARARCAFIARVSKKRFCCFACVRNLLH